MKEAWCFDSALGHRVNLYMYVVYAMHNDYASCYSPMISSARDQNRYTQGSVQDGVSGGCIQFNGNQIS